MKIRMGEGFAECFINLGRAIAVSSTEAHQPAPLPQIGETVGRACDPFQAY